MSHQMFPARTLAHRRKEGAGHWLVAYRKTEQRRHSNVCRRIKETCEECEDKEEADAAHGKTLDGPFLLQLHCVDEPSDLCSVDISEQSLSSVKAEDLKAFGNVAFIDASVNSLSLASFGSFVSLRELNLSLNGLCDMAFHAADTPHLEVLDLSYNTLSADGIVSIGQLPRLKMLHLTGNQLHHLPPNLGSSSHDATQLPAGEEGTGFAALEVLMLDDNRLSSGVFSCLANLKRLQYLSLQGNCISEIPCVELMSCSRPLQTSTEGQAEEEQFASHSTDEHFKRISWIFHEENRKAHCQGPSVPLPQLQFLNLAHNKIAKEEALMAAALFPMLRQIDIHSNPLATQRSGNTPSLTYYLQETLGIRIERKKTQDGVRLPLRVSTQPKWKVEETVPKALKEAARPAQTQVERSELRRAESEGRNGRKDEKTAFFVTQAQTTDAPEDRFDLQAGVRETVNTERNKRDRFTSYQMLLDTKVNPDVVEPTGIQTAVRMLEHTLRTLNVYRDSEPKLDSIQTPYRQREKKIKELPPVKPTKPAERVDEMIREIKERTTTREVSLSSAMHSTDKRDYKEALSLLRDMKTKYKMVHKKTMEQAVGNQLDGRSDQNGAEASC